MILSNQSSGYGHLLSVYFAAAFDVEFAGLLLVMFISCH